MYIWLKTSAPLLVVSKSLGKKKRHDTVLLLVVDRDRECWNWGTSLLQSVAERQARPSAYKEMLESYRYWERDECLHVGKRFLPRDAQHSTPLLNLLCIHFYFPEEKSNRPITHLSIHAGNIPLFWHLSLSLSCIFTSSTLQDCIVCFFLLSPLRAASAYPIIAEFPLVN